MLLGIGPARRERPITPVLRAPGGARAPARGVQAIRDATDQAEQPGRTTIRPCGDLFLGETYLQIAISGEKPALSVMLRNLRFLLQNLPFATRKSPPPSRPPPWLTKSTLRLHSCREQPNQPH